MIRGGLVALIDRLARRYAKGSRTHCEVCGARDDARELIDADIALADALKRVQAAQERQSVALANVRGIEPNR